MIARLSLPVPPTGNLYFRIYRGHPVKTREAEGYCNLVRIRAFNAHLPRIAKPREVAVRIDWHREIRQGDLDNRCKVLLDALQGALYDTDAQIGELHAYRHDGKVSRLDVIVWPRDEESPIPVTPRGQAA